MVLVVVDVVLVVVGERVEVVVLVVDVVVVELNESKIIKLIMILEEILKKQKTTFN